MDNEKILFETSACGGFKPLNAVNGGPWYKRFAASMKRSNLESYRAAKIPFARNHDEGNCSIYGGPYAHDISKIFRTADADVNAPASYDFGNTDEAILAALEAGTETFFRLGESSEPQAVPHAAIPPKDFFKWAQIAEHIIRHYNEGFANGYELGIRYWEIWNEPDLHWADVTKGFWHGTPELFFDFYATVAKHLKSCFPHLKIGGPAIAHDLAFAERFLTEMKRRDVPIDFFSWHIYATDPEHIVSRAARVRELLQACGYGDAESICNEWNYVHDWGDRFNQAIEVIQGVKGAAFTMSVISEAHRTGLIDMLMYYDVRPSCFNGVFDFYTYAPKKGYYPLFFYGQFYAMTQVLRPTKLPPHLYAVAGADADGKILCALTYYDDGHTASEERSVTLDFGRNVRFSVHLLDETHDGEQIAVTDTPRFVMRNHSVLFLREA